MNKIQADFPGRINSFIYKYDKYFLQKRLENILYELNRNSLVRFIKVVKISASKLTTAKAMFLQSLYC